MKTLATNQKSAAFFGFLMVLPLMFLEWVTASDLPRSKFSFLLFSIMWLFAAIFVLVLMQVVRSIRAGNLAKANPVSLVLKVIFLVLISWNWVGLVVDQWPCFLGATGC